MNKIPYINGLNKKKYNVAKISEYCTSRDSACVIY